MGDLVSVSLPMGDLVSVLLPFPSSSPFAFSFLLKAEGEEKNPQCLSTTVKPERASTDLIVLEPSFLPWLGG